MATESKGRPVIQRLRPRRAGLVAACLVVVAVASADVVRLKNGNVLEGNITKESDESIVLEMSSMSMTIARARVMSIEREEAQNMALQRAQTLERERKFLEAIGEYAQARKDKAVEHEAGLGIQRCRKGFCAEYRKRNQALFQEGDYDALLRQVEGDLARLPADTAARQAYAEIQGELYLQKSRNLIDRLDLPGAERLLAAASGVNPDSPDVLLEHARLLLRMKDPNKALVVLDKASAMKDAPPEWKLLTMKARFEGEDVARGLALFEELYAPGQTSGCPPEMLDRYRQECGYSIGIGYKQKSAAFADQGDNLRALECYRFGAKAMPETSDSIQKDVFFYKGIGAMADAEASQTRLEIVRQQEELAKQLRAAIASESASGGVAGSDGSGGPSSRITANSYEQALARARQNNRNALLIFSASWCGYCKKLKKDMLPTADVRRALGGYVLAELDADREKALATRLGVDGLPTLIVLDSSGRELRRMSGCPQSGSDLAAWLR
jgi:thioredoxin-like negative regulator of GroEL